MDSHPSLLYNADIPTCLQHHYAVVRCLRHQSAEHEIRRAERNYHGGNGLGVLSSVHLRKQTRVPIVHQPDILTERASALENCLLCERITGPVTCRRPLCRVVLVSDV